MFRVPVIRAWKWLFAHLVITASLSYFIAVSLALTGVAKPETLLFASTFGIRNVGIPIMLHGVSFGIDKGVMIFFCNMTVALLILSIICWVRLLNPYTTTGKFAKLRKHLQRDRTAKHLRIVPYFARIKSYQLRLSVFILLCVPFIAVIFLGIMVGMLLGSLHMASSSSLIAIAFIMPHGVPEIAALLLACSIPVAIWLIIQPTIDTEDPANAFRRIQRVASSDELQQQIKMIVNLLLIAGLVEAHFTFRIVEMVINS